MSILGINKCILHIFSCWSDSSACLFRSSDSFLQSVCDVGCQAPDLLVPVTVRIRNACDAKWSCEVLQPCLYKCTIHAIARSMAGSVSFYFVAVQSLLISQCDFSGTWVVKWRLFSFYFEESSADIAWIGCERSEIISLLGPQ